MTSEYNNLILFKIDISSSLIVIIISGPNVNSTLFLSISSKFFITFPLLFFFTIVLSLVISSISSILLTIFIFFFVSSSNCFFFIFFSKYILLYFSILLFVNLTKSFITILLLSLFNSVIKSAENNSLILL